MPLLGCAEIHEHEPTIVPPTMVSDNHYTQ